MGMSDLSGRPDGDAPRFCLSDRLRIPHEPPTTHVAFSLRNLRSHDLPAVAS